MCIGQIDVRPKKAAPLENWHALPFAMIAGTGILLAIKRALTLILTPVARG
jgi:hypothetical protein